MHYLSPRSPSLLPSSPSLSFPLSLLIITFRYAHENGCDWWSSTCWYAALGGHLDCLKYVHILLSLPSPSPSLSPPPLSLSLLMILRYAHENGCEWDKTTCANAALGGHMECLVYAHESGCPWEADTCSSAAFTGHLDCLR